MDKVVIYDSDHPGAFDNKCFESSFDTKGPGHSLTVQLALKAKSRGFRVMTGDVFLKLENRHTLRAYLVTDMQSDRTSKLIQNGAIPLINICFESPLIARNFYMTIEEKAGRFAHSIQFGGTEKRLKKTNTQFDVMYFPVRDRTQLHQTDWESRKYLSIVNSNKRVYRTDYTSINSSIRSALSRFKFFLQKLTDPWMRSREIYKDRIRAIHYFSKYRDFELYGFGWEHPISGFSVGYHHAALKAFKGAIGYESKYQLLNQFKFSICFENCEFPGYVTEKIFDCFLAGTIPIYFGAPDIHSFVPKETFIDYRKFTSIEELDSYLKSISNEEGIKMIKAAEEFLRSPDFDKYYLGNFTEILINKLEAT